MWQFLKHNSIYTSERTLTQNSLDTHITYIHTYIHRGKSPYKQIETHHASNNSLCAGAGALKATVFRFFLFFFLRRRVSCVCVCMYVCMYQIISRIHSYTQQSYTHTHSYTRNTIPLLRLTTFFEVPQMRALEQGCQSSQQV